MFLSDDPEPLPAGERNPTHFFVGNKVAVDTGEWPNESEYSRPTDVDGWWDLFQERRILNRLIKTELGLQCQYGNIPP